jgi:hypothetical protein
VKRNRLNSSAAIGYVEPNGETRYYDRYGARCDGAGYNGVMYPAYWMPRSKMPEYSVMYEFGNVVQMKAALI